MSGSKNHVLDVLYETINKRRDADPKESWTAKLLAKGVPKIAQKTGEEAVETVIAAVADDPEALTAESADLLYHLLVLWAALQMVPCYADLPCDSRQSAGRGETRIFRSNTRHSE